MVSVLDCYALPEMPMLEQIVDDLTEILHTIAHAGKSNDKKYIKDSQEYLRGKYGRFMERKKELVSDVGALHVQPAYDFFQNLNTYQKPEGIERDCEDILYEHLEWTFEFPEDYEDFFGPYLKFLQPV